MCFSPSFAVFPMCCHAAGCFDSLTWDLSHDTEKGQSRQRSYCISLHSGIYMCHVFQLPLDVNPLHPLVALKCTLTSGFAVARMVSSSHVTLFKIERKYLACFLSTGAKYFDRHVPIQAASCLLWFCSWSSNVDWNFTVFTVILIKNGILTRSMIHLDYKTYFPESQCFIASSGKGVVLWVAWQ